MFRIRLHGRGGQGIKTGGRVLGSAFFRAGFEVQDAPLYGAERRGAPMSAFVRASQSAIRERGIIARPDLVVVADDSLFQVPAANVLAGVSPQTVVLVHGSADPDALRARIGNDLRIVTLPMEGAAAPRSESGLTGARCAGAAARLAGVIAREDLGAALDDELSPLGPALLQKNLVNALAAYDAMAPHAGIVQEGVPVSAQDYAPPEWVDLPADRATLATADIFAPATMVQVRTGLWRTMRPEIDAARCNRCSWICSTLCPDSAIRVLEDRRPEVDLDHCKGCMICVNVCPPHAIAAVPERAAQAQAAVMEAQ